MASVVLVGLVPSPPAASPSPSSAAAANSKLGSPSPSAGVFRKIVSLPLLLQNSPSSCSRIVCLKSFQAFAAFSGGYSITEDGRSPVQQNASSEELSISALGIDGRIVEALAKKNITNLFPIQRAVFQPAAEGRDLIGRAKTGTGKTLAFGIPILDSISKEKQNMVYRPPGTPRSIILAPTRELAKQVENELIVAAPHLSTVCIYGGVSIEGQRRQLSGPVDVVVGTPGRVIDMLERGALRLNEVKIAILDEADQMLAVGFAEEVERIMQKLPLQRQTMLFSATMPPWIRKLTSRFLNAPTMIDLVGENEDKIAEGIKVYAISTTEPAKNRVLGDLLTVYAKGGKAIVFTKTKKDTDDVAAVMSRSIGCEALHGDISQYQREKTLSGFRTGRFSVLVATDVASRGLDIPNVDLIVHYEVPNDSETFVHRSGRTGRAGKTGTCILMYTLPQRRILRTIESEVGCKFQSIGPPAVEEVLASSSDHAVESIKSVQPEVAKLFLPAAEKLLQEQGVHALAAAMAQVSGVSKLPPKRSLLTQEEGFVTLQMTGEHMGNSSAVSSAVMQMSSKAGLSMGRVSMISSPQVKGGVFDVPEEAARELLSLQGTGISELKVLPDLEEDYFQQSYDGFGRGRSFNGGFRSGGSSYGGSSYGSNNRSGYGSYAGSGTGYGGSSYSRSGSGYGGSSYGRNASYGNSNFSGGNSSYNNGRAPYDNNAYGGNNSRINYDNSGVNSRSYGNSGGDGSTSGYRSLPAAGYGSSSSSSGYGGPASYGGSSTPGYGGSASPGYGGPSSSGGYAGPSSLGGYGAPSSSGFRSSPPGRSLPAGNSPTGYGYSGSSSSAYGYGGSSSTGGYGGNPSTGYGGSVGNSSPGYGDSRFANNPPTPNASNDFGWRKGESNRNADGNRSDPSST